MQLIQSKPKYNCWNRIKQNKYYISIYKCAVCAKSTWKKRIVDDIIVFFFPSLPRNKITGSRTTNLTHVSLTFCPRGYKLIYLDLAKKKFCSDLLERTWVWVARRLKREGCRLVRKMGGLREGERERGRKSFLRLASQDVVFAGENWEYDVIPFARFLSYSFPRRILAQSNFKGVGLQALENKRYCVFADYCH